VLNKVRGAKAGIIAFGSTESAVVEAQHLLIQEHGLKADFLRIRSIPFADEVRTFIKKFESVYIVELNRDGQLKQLLTIAYPDLADRLVSIARSDGLSATATWIAGEIKNKEAH
jgi:2-oxoglutarate ferredoxin oxidoreductase subunit alpha